jgi:hypothetical protein
MKVLKERETCLEIVWCSRVLSLNGFEMAVAENGVKRPGQ